MIYLSYFFISFVISLFVTVRRQALSVVLFLTFIFIGLSFPAGGDWIGYFQNYDCSINNICNSDFTMFEYGYELIVNIFGYLGFQSIIIFIAIINIFAIRSFSIKFDKPAIVVVFFMCMFLWSLYIEAIRQSLAISLLLFGIFYLYKYEIKKFIFIIILASLFHITALICLVFVIPYFSLRISKFVSFLLLTFAMLFVVTPIPILEFLIQLLPENSIAGMKLSFYLFSDKYSPQVSIGLGTILDFVLLGILLLTFWRNYKSDLKNDIRFHNVVFLGVALYLSFGVFAGKMMPVITRVGWYGLPFVIIFIYSNLGKSIYYKKVDSSGKPLLTNIVIFIYFMLQILRPLTYEYNNYGIMNQKLIIQKIYNLDDASLRIEANNKCYALTNLGYGYLCGKN
ncbi:EpsG family protein [Acinetobacter seifertii]|uniref:EpsG family protein n=1 Tax=Acinetobacter seifertii TaxID=1530123 RepID=UPI00168CC3B0|nr:EpsG family protein [Acinetobacter seifertii]MDV4264913.1 EpsG family protein [Acinetobacter seifertii]QNY06381.1 EpsG family protein [Acinetobacter seifertii]